MRQWLYTCVVRVYVAGIYAASLFNNKARLWIRGRRQMPEQISRAARSLGHAPVIWFHCASLGEFEMARPLMEKVRLEKPSYKILLTFFSPSGYELRKNWKGADAVLYLPADTPRNARLFVDALQPQLAVFVKYEYWLNFLAALHSRQIKTFMVCAVFNHEQVFFKSYGRIFQKALQQFAGVFVQDTPSVELAVQLGVTAQPAGDMRYDRVLQNARNAGVPAGIQEFTQNAFTLVCGSTWPAEEKILSQWMRTLPVGVKIIVAPHDVSENHIRQLERLITVPHVRYSKLNQDSMSRSVLIIDNIGMLSSLYRVARAAVVGGGFSGKLHNILEPAVYGIPVLMGPHHQRFHEAQELLNAGGAFTFTAADDFIQLIQRLMQNDDYRLNSGVANRKIVEQQSGATTRIFNAIFSQEMK